MRVSICLVSIMFKRGASPCCVLMTTALLRSTYHIRIWTERCLGSSKKLGHRLVEEKGRSMLVVPIPSACRWSVSSVSLQCCGRAASSSDAHGPVWMWGMQSPELKAAGSFLIFKCSLFLAGGNSILHVSRTLPGCEIQLQIRHLGCGLCYLWAAYSEEDLRCYCKSANQDGLNNLTFYPPEVHAWLIAFLTHVFLSLLFKAAD